MRKAVAFFLAGALLGGIVVSLLNASRLDQLYLEKENLKVQLFETADRLRQLEKQWVSRREDQVRAVTIELETGAGAFAALALHQAVSQITADLVGEKVSTLHPPLLLKLLHGRILAVEDKDYRLSVNWIILGEEIVFNLSAVPAGN